MNSALVPRFSNFDSRVEGVASGLQVADDMLPHRRNQRSLNSAGERRLSVARV